MIIIVVIFSNSLLWH